MTVQVILNPYAGRWSAKKRIPEVQVALQQAGIDYRLDITQGPRHAIDLAEQAVRGGCDAVIAAGGDGTIGEVVNGICRGSLLGVGDAIKIPLGVFALGSANDFVVNLGLNKDLKQAAAAISARKLRRIDLGRVGYSSSGVSAASGVSYFDNNSAVGLEPSITLIQQKIPLIQGTPRYLLATVIGIIQHPQWDAHLEWEGGSYDGPTSLVTVGNNPLTGGLFYMTPHADPADGRLTFVYGYMRTRLQTLRLLPRTMKPGAGSYVEHPDIHEVHSPWLRIRLNQPTPLHADGEIQHRAVREINYQVLPGMLPVIIP
jgi:diacylglycerol kinase (ATP)